MQALHNYFQERLCFTRHALAVSMRKARGSRAACPLSSGVCLHEHFFSPALYVMAWWMAGPLYKQTRYHLHFFRKCTFCTLILCTRVTVCGWLGSENQLGLCVCVCVCNGNAYNPSSSFFADEHILEGYFFKWSKLLAKGFYSNISPMLGICMIGNTKYTCVCRGMKLHFFNSLKGWV